MRRKEAGRLEGFELLPVWLPGHHNVFTTAGDASYRFTDQQPLWQRIDDLSDSLDSRSNHNSLS